MANDDPFTLNLFGNAVLSSGLVLGSGPIEGIHRASFTVQGGAAMSELFWLSGAQLRRIEPCFPLSHGMPRVDDRRVLAL